jgi:hypothetical protein
MELRGIDQLPSVAPAPNAHLDQEKDWTNEPCVSDGCATGEPRVRRPMLAGAVTGGHRIRVPGGRERRLRARLHRTTAEVLALAITSATRHARLQAHPTVRRQARCRQHLHVIASQPTSLGACHARATRQGAARSAAVTHGHSPTPDQDHRSRRSSCESGDRTSKLVMRVRFPSSALFIAAHPTNSVFFSLLS